MNWDRLKSRIGSFSSLEKYDRLLPKRKNVLVDRTGNYDQYMNRDSGH